MSTQPIWSRLQQAYLRPPKPRPVVSLINNPKARLRDLKRVTLPNEKARAPTVFNWIKPSVIWRASETREHKTKRRQEPHVREWRMPVTILAGKEARDKPMMPFVWMKMAHRDLKQVERAGGLEAKMVRSIWDSDICCPASSWFTPRIWLTFADLLGEQELFDKRKTAPKRPVPPIISTARRARIA
jgi:hypothetical protein